jgi:flagellar basal-body rod protein FlgG
MNHAFEIAGAGLAGQQRALDVIANNIANVNTLGFKRSDVRFVELIATTRDPLNPSTQLGVHPSVAGVSAQVQLMFSDQGQIEPTGRALDFAIDGEGFVEVMGPRGETLLWRGGSLSVQEDGLLATADGLALRAAITVPHDAELLQIDDTGVVRVRMPGDTEAVEIGQINLVRPTQTGALEALDGGLFRVSDTAGLLEAAPGQDGAGLIVQGSVERSNVELSDEMIRLLLVQRAYAANAQIVQAADQLMAIANNLRR